MIDAIRPSPKARGFLLRTSLYAVAVASLILVRSAAPAAGQSAESVPDMSGEYEFLAPEDTLGILDEDGKLKGYIDVAQSAEESDVVLSYQITIGTRQGNRVEFKTSKIHEKYFRFSGTAERGNARKEADPDYLRLVGDLEIVTLNGETGQEHIERQRVIFRSKGKSRSGED